METKRALTGTKTSQGFSLYYRNTKLTACCGVIGRVRESRNPKKVIRVALMESYGEIGRVPVNLFGIDSEKIRYASSDRIQMLSKFAEFKRCDQEQLRYLSYRNLQSRKFPQDSHRKYQDVVVEQYYHTVKRSNGAFERELNPIDLLAPQFVQPEKNNPRILKQDGAFIISGLDKNADESNMKIRKYLVNEIHVPALCKALIKDQLANVGISQATLFPEVDKVADYLKRII